MSDWDAAEAAERVEWHYLRQIDPARAGIANIREFALGLAREALRPGLPAETATMLATTARLLEQIYDLEGASE